MKKTNKFSPEVRERVVRTAQKQRFASTPSCRSHCVQRTEDWLHATDPQWGINRVDSVFLPTAPVVYSTPAKADANCDLSPVGQNPAVVAYLVWRTQTSWRRCPVFSYRSYRLLPIAKQGALPWVVLAALKANRFHESRGISTLQKPAPHAVRKTASLSDRSRAPEWVCKSM